MNTSNTNLPKETWHQDAHDADLWHGAHGVLVNTAALEARAPYYKVVRVYQAAPGGTPAVPRARAKACAAGLIF